MQNTIHRLIGCAVIAGVLFLYAAHLPVTERVGLFFQNVHFLLRGPLMPESDTVIAAVDEKSIDELGRWPWSRQILARLVDKLVDSGARVIGFDVVFSSPEDSLGGRVLNEVKGRLEAEGLGLSSAYSILRDSIMELDSDARFATALKNSRRSVLGYFFHFSPSGLEHLSESQLHASFESIYSDRFRGFIKSRDSLDLSSIPLRSVYAVESNVPALSGKGIEAGSISFDVSVDGSVRKLPVVVRYHDITSGKDHYFPAFSLRVLEKYLGGMLLFKVGDLGIEKVLLDSPEPVEIPVNRYGETFVNFLGARYTFPHFSVTDILNDRIPRERLEGKIVLVGATATALEDLKVTPFDPVLPGVEMHATIIDNILRGQVLRQPEWLFILDSASLILWGMIATFVYSRVGAFPGLLCWIGISALQFGFGHWTFSSLGFFVSEFFFVLENFILFLSLTIYRYAREEKQKRFIQNVFSQYLSPTVVEKLVKHPSSLKLGGEQKELTAMFTDLAGFTTFSEKLSATELVDFLNEYFTEMTEILIRNEGTLDRYDGDAIKAFFGAPVYFEDHAKRACWVCIEMQDRLSRLRKRWREEGKPELIMRIGINTGSMVVGNLGSKIRMAYGMNGDSVNLAARLEGVNKYYGTNTIISESTCAQARAFIEVRELDRIRVVGRATAVTIYELLGKKGTCGEGLLKAMGYFEQGLGFYREKEWGKAISRFEAVLELCPADEPSAKFIGRCREYRDHPPDEKWDGVFILTGK